MKLEKTREALDLASELIENVGPCDHDAGICVCGDKATRDAASEEVAQAEALLREAAALKVFAMAGLSAFHGRLCSGGGAHGLNMPTNPADCQDPKCRAWAAAVRGDIDATLKELTTLKDGEYDEAKRDARNAALEEAATKAETMGRGWGILRSMEMTSHARAATKIADALRALKWGG